MSGGRSTDTTGVQTLAGQGNQRYDNSVLEPFLENFEKVMENLTIETDEIWRRWNEEQQLFFEESANRFKKDMERFQQCWISDLAMEIKRKNIEFFSNNIHAPTNTSWDNDPLSLPKKFPSESVKMEVQLDTSGYNPEELEVNVCSGIICVQGKHEEKSEEGKVLVSREFTRNYTLPLNARAEDVDSSLSKEGILIITAR